MEALASGKVWKNVKSVASEDPHANRWFIGFGYDTSTMPPREVSYASHTEALAALLGGPDPEPKKEN